MRVPNFSEEMMHTEENLASHSDPQEFNKKLNTTPKKTHTTPKAYTIEA